MTHHPSHAAVRWYRAALSVIWIAGSAWLVTVSLRRHWSLHTNAFDLGIFDQVLWNTWRTGTPWSTILERHFFGEHFQPVLYVLAPLKARGLGPEVLLVTQALALGGAVWAVASYARDRIGRAWALAFAGAWFVFPALWGVAFFDFHPYALSAPFFAMAILLWSRQRVLGVILLLVAIGLIREDLWLAVAGFGAVIALDRRRRWVGWTLMCGGVAMALLLVFVVIPSWRHEPYEFLQRFAWRVPVESVTGRGPAFIAWVRHADPWRRMLFLLQILGPLALLPLYRPRWLIAAAPTLTLLLLSAHRPQYSIGFHYAAPVLPFLFGAAIDGVAALPAARQRVVPFAVLTVVVCLASQPWTVWREWTPTPADAAARALLASVPPGSSVSAQGQLVPHLASRPGVFLFPRVNDAQFIALIPRLADRGPISEADYQAWLRRLHAGDTYDKVGAAGGAEVFRRRTAIEDR